MSGWSLELSKGFDFLQNVRSYNKWSIRKRVRAKDNENSHQDNLRRILCLIHCCFQESLLSLFLTTFFLRVLDTKKKSMNNLNIYDKIKYHTGEVTSQAAAKPSSLKQFLQIARYKIIKPLLPSEIITTCILQGKTLSERNWRIGVRYLGDDNVLPTKGTAFAIKQLLFKTCNWWQPLTTLELRSHRSKTHSCQFLPN